MNAKPHPRQHQAIKIRFRVFNTPLGPAAIVFRGRRLARLYLPEPGLRQRVKLDFPEAIEDRALAAGLVGDLKRYFDGQPRRFRVKLDFSQLSDFARQVLRACAQVRAGRTVTYAELAARISKPRAARAVGQALRRNPFPVVIPCHRVVGADGSLRGYAGTSRRGLRLKQFLLELERRQVPGR